MTNSNELPLPKNPRQTVNGRAQHGDWCTPLWLLELAASILGNLDLDPSANPLQEYPFPQTYAGLGEPGDPDDGLAQTWGAGTRVWLNPPWGSRRPKVGSYPCWASLATWLQKAEDQAKLGSHIITVGPASTGTKWFQKHVGASAAFCLLKGRVKFVRPGFVEAEVSSPGLDNYVALYTSNEEILESFCDKMDHIGIVLELGVCDLSSTDKK